MYIFKEFFNCALVENGFPNWFSSRGLERVHREKHKNLIYQQSIFYQPCCKLFFVSDTASLVSNVPYQAKLSVFGDSREKAYPVVFGMRV